MKAELCHRHSPSEKGAPVPAAADSTSQSPGRYVITMLSLSATPTLAQRVPNRGKVWSSTRPLAHARGTNPSRWASSISVLAHPLNIVREHAIYRLIAVLKAFPVGCSSRPLKESTGRSNGAVSCSAMPERKHQGRLDEYYEACLESGENEFPKGARLFDCPPAPDRTTLHPEHPTLHTISNHFTLQRTLHRLG